MSDFKFIKSLGKGSFAEVTLSIHLQDFFLQLMDKQKSRCYQIKHYGAKAENIGLKGIIINSGKG